MDIAETINDHFTNVAQVLAHIPVVDVNPESYLEPTDPSLSLQNAEYMLILFLTFCRN